MSTEKEKKNIFSFYKWLVETKTDNLTREMWDIRSDYGYLCFLGDELLISWKRTESQYCKLRSREVSLKVFQIIQEIVESSDEENEVITFNKYLKKLNNIIAYLKKQTFTENEYKTFINDLELVRENLKKRFDFENILTPQVQVQAKIKWLGKTNVLASLFYDLWQGQNIKKGKPATKAIIETDKKDLMAFLINNFTDSKGGRLSESTMNDYLNSAKPDKRAGIGARIEFEIPSKAF